MHQTIDRIYELLANVPDPEIPVINIIELGILRDVIFYDNFIEIKITPTYSGCPAMHMIEMDITSILHQHNITNFKITTILSPAWTTDWITEEAREKLRKYGIAPPLHSTQNKIKNLLGDSSFIQCPRCNSTQTKLLSEFGSTACKALHQCLECKEPFDYFKCH